jgi:Flp pilus assembly protein TadD
MREFEKAVSVLEKLRSREDSPPQTLYYLGHSLMRVGRREEAKAAFEQFLDEWRGDEELAAEVRDILVTL